MKRSTLFQKEVQALPLIGITMLAAACEILGYPPQPDNSWEIASVTVVDPLPRTCSDAAGHGIVLQLDKPHTPPVQQAGWHSWVEGVGPPTGFFDARYKCAIAAVRVKQRPGMPQTVAGKPLALYVTHPHAGDPNNLDTLQSLIYQAKFETNGQTELVFPRVIIASAWIGENNTWDNLQRAGGVTVHLGQWPVGGKGSQIVENGVQLKKNCTFFAGSGAINCP